MKADIILAGVGGQGILTIATILGKAALDEGLFLKQAEVHGMSQRGGDVQSNLRISDSKIHSDLIPLGGADLILSLEPMEALRYLPWLAKTGRIVTNSVPFVNINNYPEITAVENALAAVPGTISLNMDAMATECGSPRSSNIVLLGAALNFVPLDYARIEDAMCRIFAPKGEKVVMANKSALKAGYDAAKDYVSHK